jgi:transposase
MSIYSCRNYLAKDKDKMRVSQEELDKVKAAMNAVKKVKIFRRFQALYLYLSGKTCKEVAEIVGLNKSTVSEINQIYKNEGLAGIPYKPKAGRPPRLTKKQQAGIKEMILNKLPSDVGFPAEFNWTAGLVAKYIKQEYGCDYSIRGITKILDRLGLSYTRPTYVLAKADKQKQEQFVQDFENLKKNC